MSIVTRQGKGSRLSVEEMDGNFTYLDQFTRKYKVYTALLAQSGVDTLRSIFWDDSVNNLTIGVTYEITNSTNVDFTNVGAANNNIGTKFVATGITPNSWGGGVLDYNEGVPVVTVLENTIGDIWFTYEGIGLYYLKSNSLFVNSKTWYSILANANGSGGHLFNLTYIDDSTILVEVTTGDSVLNNTPIKIEVYN